MRIPRGHEELEIGGFTEISEAKRTHSWKPKKALVAGIGISLGLAGTATSAAADPYGAPGNHGTGQTATSNDAGVTSGNGVDRNGDRNSGGTSNGSSSHIENERVASPRASGTTPSIGPVAQQAPLTLSDPGYSLLATPNTSEPKSNLVELASQSESYADNKDEQLAGGTPGYGYAFAGVPAGDLGFASNSDATKATLNYTNADYPNPFAASTDFQPSVDLQVADASGVTGNPFAPKEAPAEQTTEPLPSLQTEDLETAPATQDPNQQEETEGDLIGGLRALLEAIKNGNPALPKEKSEKVNPNTELAEAEARYFNPTPFWENYTEPPSLQDRMLVAQKSELVGTPDEIRALPNLEEQVETAKDAVFFGDADLEHGNFIDEYQSKPVNSLADESVNDVLPQEPLADEVPTPAEDALVRHPDETDWEYLERVDPNLPSGDPADEVVAEPEEIQWMDSGDASELIKTLGLEDTPSNHISLINERHPEPGLSSYPGYEWVELPGGWVEVKKAETEVKAEVPGLREWAKSWGQK